MVQMNDFSRDAKPYSREKLQPPDFKLWQTLMNRRAGTCEYIKNKKADYRGQ